VRDNDVALAIDDVDDAWREGTAEGLQHRVVEQHAEARRLEEHDIAHDQRRDQRAEGLVHGVVVWPHAQRNADRRAADLGDGAIDDLEARVAVVEPLQLLDRGADVVDGPIEFFCESARLLPIST
jgi:hypothetical protein